MDMSAEQVVGRMLSMYIFDTFHIELSSDEIFSSKKGYILSGKNYEYVQEALKWYEKVEKVWTIYDKNVSAGGLYKRILDDMLKEQEANENEEVKANDVIEILTITDCNLAKSIYNSDVYEGDALL